MKRFSTFITIILITMIISACGAEPVPTVNPVDIQNTAIAAASTMVAQTMAAIPTATPLPPTETPTQTPLPTNTPVPLPTLDPASIVAASPTTASSGDPCEKRMLKAGMKGHPTKIRIVNTLRDPIMVSIYLNEEAGSGSCGWASFQLGKGADVVVDDWVTGCYNLWAWSAEGAKKKFNSSGSGCINNSDKWTFEVNTATIKFIGP